MTVSVDTPSKVTRDGNGVATSFSFPFTIFESTDLVVTHVDADGVETTLFEGAGTANYSVTVSSYPGSGSITYPASGSGKLASGESLVIRRVMPLEQETDLGNQGGYFPETVEQQFDKLVMIDKQQQEEIDRSPKLPVSFDGTMGEIDTPTAGYYLRRNATNDGWEHAAIATTDGDATNDAAEDVSMTAGAAGASAEYARADHVHLLSVITAVKNFIEAATLLAAQQALDLEPGVDIQAYDAELAALAGLTSAANKLPYFTGSGTAALADLSAFARTILDDADAAAVRATISAGRVVFGTPLQTANLASAATTQAHGLGAKPTFLIAELECLTAELNYSIGDRFRVSLDRLSNASATSWTIYDDATNVVALLNGNVINAANKTTRANGNLTNTKWKLVVTPVLLTV